MGIGEEEVNGDTGKVDVDALVNRELEEYGDVYRKWVEHFGPRGHKITPEGLARMEVSERLAFKTRYPHADFSQVRRSGLFAEASPDWVDLNDSTTYEEVEDRLVDREEHARQLGGKPEDYGESQYVWRRVRYCRGGAGVEARKRFLEQHFGEKDGKTVFFAEAYDGTGVRIEGYLRQYYARPDLDNFVAQLFEASRLKKAAEATNSASTPTDASTAAPGPASA